MENTATQNDLQIQLEALKKRITFRKGREEDYLEVLGLNWKVYGGYDYLPALYHKYIRDPFRWSTITELDGKIAVCGFANLIDDGRTVIGNAARVDDSKKGLGLWHITKNAPALVDDSMIKNVEKLVTSTPNWEEYRLMRRRGAKLDLRQTRNLFKVHLSTDAPPLRMKPRTNLCLVTKPMTKPQVMAAMDDVDNRWQLFPHGKIVFSWDPYKLLPSNLERIYDSSCMWVATKHMSATNPSACHSISLARTHFIAKGTRYDISYYCSQDDDLDDLHNHLATHLTYAREISVHDGVHVYLIVPANIDREKVNNVVEKITGFRIKGSGMRMYLAEQPWVTTASKL